MALKNKYSIEEVLNFFSGEGELPTFSDSSDSDVELTNELPIPESSSSEVSMGVPQISDDEIVSGLIESEGELCPRRPRLDDHSADSESCDASEEETSSSSSDAQDEDPASDTDSDSDEDSTVTPPPCGGRGGRGRRPARGNRGGRMRGGDRGGRGKGSKSKNTATLPDNAKSITVKDTAFSPAIRDSFCPLRDVGPY